MSEILETLRDTASHRRGGAAKPCFDCGGEAEVFWTVAIRDKRPDKNGQGAYLKSKSLSVCAACAVKRFEANA